MSKFQELTNLLHQETTPLYIQTHDFPDHDAVATAFALRTLLETKGIRASIVYEGALTRDSLVRMIRELGISVTPAEEAGLKDEDRIVVVDGCVGNRNVTDVTGREIAVIDHHIFTLPPEVVFTDIRPEYGACSTLIYEYYLDAGVRVSKNVATALMVGLNIDTALLTRGAIQADVDAYAKLFASSDIDLVHSILLNNIEVADLAYYDYAMHHTRMQGGVSFCYIPHGCAQNLLGILSDFYLTLKEIDVAVICARNGNVVNFSVRSERRDVPANVLVMKILEGLGYGGGHHQMAGGIVKDAALFDEEAVYRRIIDLIEGGNL